MKKWLIGLLIVALLMPTLAAAQEPDRVEMGKEILTELFSGEAEAVFDRLTPQMQEIFPLESIKDLPAQLSVAGAFAGFGATETIGQTAVIHLQMEVLDLVAQITFDADGLVEGFWVTFDNTAPDTLDSEDLVEIAKEIVTQLFAGEAEAVFSRLSPELQEGFPPESIVLLPKQMTDSVGAFVGFGNAETVGETVVLMLEMEFINLVAQLTIDKDGVVTGFWITLDSAVYEPQPLGDYEEAVEIGEYKLPGVLTVPEGENLPAVVLVHGSGPQNRDETVGNTAVFADLAEGLAARGIAVLRYDKRTYLMQTGAVDVTAEEIANMTVYEETIEDAVAAVQLLKEDPRIDPERVFVLGHSLGGMLANRIELAGADTRGLIILAGTLRSLATVLADQLEVLDGEAYAEDIALARSMDGLTEEEARVRTLFGTNTYYFWEEAQHDLTAIAEESGAPMLILQGTEDTQVYPDRDYPLWEAFAAQYPHRDITLKLYEGLGHLFTIDEKFSTEVLGDIAEWILSR